MRCISAMAIASCGASDRALQQTEARNDFERRRRSNTACARGRVRNRICSSGRIFYEARGSRGNDEAECRALKAVIPNALVYTGKPALGESVGAAGLWQVILATQALRSAELPPVLHADPAIALPLPLSRTRMTGARRAIVLSCG